MRFERRGWEFKSLRVRQAIHSESPRVGSGFRLQVSASHSPASANTPPAFATGTKGRAIRRLAPAAKTVQEDKEGNSALLGEEFKQSLEPSSDLDRSPVSRVQWKNYCWIGCRTYWPNLRKT